MQFSVVLAELWALVSRTNKYIDETSPWVLAKEEADRGKLSIGYGASCIFATSYCGAVTAVHDRITETDRGTTWFG